MKSETMIYAATVVLGCLAFALNLRAFLLARRSRMMEREQERERRAKCAVLEVAREFLQLELLAGGRGKHHAYHVAENGMLLAVDAVAYYLAVFARMDDFWHVVAAAGGCGRNPFAVSLDKIDLGDGKGHYTFIDDYGRKAFVDGIVPPGLFDFYDGARVTADDFKNAVVDAQAEAGKRNRSRYSMIIQD